MLEPPCSRSCTLSPSNLPSHEAGPTCLLGSPGLGSCGQTAQWSRSGCPLTICTQVVAFSSHEQEIEAAETLCEPHHLPDPLLRGGRLAEAQGPQCQASLSGLTPFCYRSWALLNIKQGIKHWIFKNIYIKSNASYKWLTRINMGIFTGARSASCGRHKYGHFYRASLYIHPAKANHWVGCENQGGKIYMFLIILP